jgi:hypothetical protein
MEEKEDLRFFPNFFPKFPGHTDGVLLGNRGQLRHSEKRKAGKSKRGSAIVLEKIKQV